MSARRRCFLMIVLAPPSCRPAAGVGRRKRNHLAIALEPLGDTAIRRPREHLLDTR